MHISPARSISLRRNFHEFKVILGIEGVVVLFVRAPEYTWEDVYSAEQYLLVVKDSSSNVKVWNWHNAVNICSAGTCAASPAGVLLPDDSYTWWVLPTNSYGNGFWSLPGNFTVVAP